MRDTDPTVISYSDKEAVEARVGIDSQLVDNDPRTRRPSAGYLRVAAGIAAGVLTLTGCNTPVKASPENPGARPVPVDTGPTPGDLREVPSATPTTATPGETTTTPETEYKPTPIEVGLSHEEYTKALMERYNAWANASSKPGLYEKAISMSNEEWSKTLPKIVDKDSQPYIDALYVKEWQNQRRLPEDIAYRKEITKNSARKFVASEDPGNYDQPFKRTTEFELDTSRTRHLEGGGRQIVINYTTHDTAKNTYTPGMMIIATAVEDGGERIMDIL